MDFFACKEPHMAPLKIGFAFDLFFSCFVSFAYISSISSCAVKSILTYGNLFLKVSQIENTQK